MVAPVTILPSPRSVLRESALASLVFIGGVAFIIVFLGFLVHAWVLYHAWSILAWSVAGFACYCTLATVCTLFLRVPRVEINSEGFATIGAAGRRFRRWSEIEGDFAIGRFFMRPAVVWRLTEEARKTAGIQKKNSPPDHDETIMFSTELSLRPAELVKLLNQWKQNASTPNEPQ